MNIKIVAPKLPKQNATTPRQSHSQKPDHSSHTPSPPNPLLKQVTEQPTIILPQLFNLEFQFEGTPKGRGLYSLELQIKPHPNNTGTISDQTTFARNIVDLYKQQLDLVFKHVIKGSRNANITDIEHLFRLGYTYEMQHRAPFVAKHHKRCLNLFTSTKPIYLHTTPTYGIHSADLQSSHLGINTTPESPTIHAKFELPHTINSCFFYFTLALPRLLLTRNASRSIANLTTLINAAAEPSLDQLFTMIPPIKLQEPDTPSTSTAAKSAACHSSDAARQL